MVANLEDDNTGIFIDGQSYISVFRDIHQRFQPRTYLEIGTQFGDTLELSTCKSVAVDPNFQISDQLRAQPNLTLREMTSDDYFNSFNPTKDLGFKVDFAFINGMHEFEYVLRDFINTEKFCSNRSIIALHDCVPLDDHMARRYSNFHVNAPSKYPNYWTGDVWKIVPVLRKYRPDLEFHCLDAITTGLAICRNLDPKNRVLERHYDAIVEEWTGVTLKDFGMQAFYDVAEIESADAWSQTIEPIRIPLTTRLRKILRPRRRLQSLVRALT